MTKTKRISFVVLGLALFLLMPTPAYPQGSSVSVAVVHKPERGEIDVNGWPEITLTVSVLDSNGVIIPNLEPKDFIVLEDSRPVKISFAQVAEQIDSISPIHICLAMDANGSMGNTSGVTSHRFIEDAQDAANRFVGSVLVGSLDDACIVSFSDKVENLSTPVAPKELDFIRSTQKISLTNMINNLQPDSKRGKPLYDGVLKSIKIASTKPAGARTVLVLAEGRDERLAADGSTTLEGSDSDANRTIQAARDARIPVYTIGVGNDAQQKYLKRLAEETGGKYLDTFMVQDAARDQSLDNFFTDIKKRLRTQYTVRYQSLLAGDGKDHVLQVRARTLAAEAETRETITYPLIEGPIAVTIARWIGILFLIGLVLAIIIVGIRRATPATFADGGIQGPEDISTLTGGSTSGSPGSFQSITTQSASGPSGDVPGVTSVFPTTGDFAQDGPSSHTIVLKAKPTSFAFLVMSQGDHQGKEFMLQPDSTMIGRAGTNDVVVDDQAVSRQQAKIKSEGKDFYLYDLSSTNLTKINGAEVRGRHKLAENDQIQMGRTVFVFKRVDGAG